VRVPAKTAFTKAQIALEKAVAKNPRDPGAEVALGKVYVMSDHLPRQLRISKKRENSSRTSLCICQPRARLRRRGNAIEANEALRISGEAESGTSRENQFGTWGSKAAFGTRIEQPGAATRTETKRQFVVISFQCAGTDGRPSRCLLTATI